MDIKPFISAIDQICEEKGIPREKAIETVEMALAAAYKKEYDRRGQNIKVELNLETGKMKVFQVKLVVDESMLKPESDETEEEDKEAFSEENGQEEDKRVRFNTDRHIMVKDANKLTAKEGVPKKKVGKLKAGDEVELPLESAGNFGRIAAQTAKQVIIQRIREAERESIFDEYKDKEGEVVSGVVQRMERGNVYLDVGKATGILFPEEQIAKEYYRIGQRLKVYVVEVQKDSHGPSIILSRAHPKMISQLFALEVPEISAGTVEIKSIAREAGSRSKIAVTSSEERVDPIGSMIGQKGTRVQAVINELGGEKVDIVEWSENPAEFISQALSPAKVLNVETGKKGEARVVVPEDQLSLAIGIKGQNVRLAAKLTGWKIDIVAHEEPKAKTKKKKETKKVKTKKAAKKTVGIGVGKKKKGAKTVKPSKKKKTAEKTSAKKKPAASRGKTKAASPKGVKKAKKKS